MQVIQLCTTTVKNLRPFATLSFQSPLSSPSVIAAILWLVCVPPLGPQQPFHTVANHPNAIQSLQTPPADSYPSGHITAQ